MLCIVMHCFAEELRARIYGLFGLKNAGQRVDIIDNASALGMLFFVTCREVTNVSVVWGSPSIIVIGLME